MDIYIQKIAADRFTPLVVFRKLQGIALLESAVLEIGKSRYSIILAEEAHRLILNDKGIFKETNGAQKCLSKDRTQFLKFLKKESDKIKSQKRFEIPIPACGIGYLGYETAELFDTVKLKKQRDELKIPDAIFIYGSVFVIFDHYKDEIHVVSISYNKKTNAKDKAQAIINRLLDDDFSAYHFNNKQYACEAKLDHKKENFIKAVKKLKNNIIAG